MVDSIESKGRLFGINGYFSPDPPPSQNCISCHNKHARNYNRIAEEVDH